MLQDIVLWSPPTVHEPAFYCEPIDAWVSRRPVLGSRFHASGFVVDPRDNLIKPTESQIEHNALITFMSERPTSVECQPPPIKYRDPHGVKRPHTFDFRVTLSCGRRIAVYVKPSGRVRIKKLDLFVQLLANEMPDDFADEVCMVTERDLPRWLASNAQLICSALSDLDQSLDDKIAQTAASIAAPVTIAQLSQDLGGPGKTTRAIARLIYREVLQQCAPGLIRPDTLVAHRSATDRASN